MRSEQEKPGEVIPLLVFRFDCVEIQLLDLSYLQAQPPVYEAGKMIMGGICAACAGYR